MVQAERALPEHTLHTAFRRQAASGEKGPAVSALRYSVPDTIPLGSRGQKESMGVHMQEELEMDELLLSVASDQHGSFL